jgi:hypothetical protein
MKKSIKILEKPSNISQMKKSEDSSESTPQSEEKKLQDYFSEVRRQATEAHQYYEERFKTK